MENIPRNHSVGPPREDSKSNDRLQCEQENFKGSMARKKETKKHVNTIHRIMLANSRSVIGLCWGLDQKKKRCGTYTDKPNGSWDRTAQKMMANFSRFWSSNISCLQGQGLLWQEMTHKIETQFQCRHLQEGRRP